jgi:hypothetical protein
MTFEYFASKRGIDTKRVLEDIGSAKEIQFDEIILNSVDEKGNAKAHKAKTFQKN